MRYRSRFRSRSRSRSSSSSRSRYGVKGRTRGKRITRYGVSRGGIRL